MQPIVLARYITKHLIPRNTDGGTYDPRAVCFPVFNDEKTYLVSRPGHELRLGVQPNIGQLALWLQGVRTLLGMKQHYLGWWRDGSDAVFDVSVAIDGERNFVLGLAKLWRQDAIYHPASEAVLYTASEFERAA